MLRKSLVFAAALLAGTSLGAHAQTVTPLKHPTPPDGTVYGFQLMDGSLFFQGGDLQDWWRFRPDKSGSYVNGQFYPAASLPADYIPYATSGGVLPDGRVFLIGGEYLELTANVLTFELTNKMAIYDPRADTWTMVAPPFGWDFIGDSPWTLLSNGHLLLGQKLTKKAAELNPKTLTWTEVSTFGKQDIHSEEGFTLLPDGSVLTVDVTDHPHAQRFLPNPNPSLTQWVDAGSTPANLQATDTIGVENIVFDNGKKVYHPPGEIGPAILLPDGDVFASGAACTLKGTGQNDCVVYSPVGHTAVYRTATGAWTAGPDFPNKEGAGDSFANLLPNGNVLVEANPPGITNDQQANAQARFQGIRNGAARPAAIYGAAAPASTAFVWRFYEYNPKTNLLTYEPAADFVNVQASTLLLPTGQVMLNGQEVYTTSGMYLPAWAPAITMFSSDVYAGASYQIFGKQFNGLSQANAFGDEFGVATNYPLVRITNNATGDVKYARAYNPSSMGVATGSKVVSTWFEVPTNIEAGDSKLAVVANGIPSMPVSITVHKTLESAN
jgi:hypothetical protein